MKVLWLASWYPDEYEPTNGDFVQRHAKAVSRLMHVEVIHVAQAGKDAGHLNKVVLHNEDNLQEAIHYFPFKKTGIAILDKIRYNKTYLRYYNSILRQYIKEKGRPDLVHVHVPMKAGIAALELLRELNIPYIVSEHSSLYVTAAKDNFYTRSFYFRHHTKKIFRHAALVTNVSTAIGKLIQQLFGLHEVKTIPNVVDTDHFNVKPKEKNKPFRWLHASTMLPLKNVDKIIRAFKNIAAIRDDWELVIAGPVNEEYRQLTDQLDLHPKITFIGEISYEQVAAEMQRSDAFILFSQHENFPCVIIEALCCGLPVVAPGVGGIPEAVHKTNGILVEPNNIQALENAIISMMNNSTLYDPGEIAAGAIAKYSYQTVAKQFIAGYNAVLDRR